MNDATVKLLRKLKDGNGHTSGRRASWPVSRMSCSTEVMICNSMPLAIAGTRRFCTAISLLLDRRREGRSLQRLTSCTRRPIDRFKITQRADGLLVLREAVKCLR